MTDHSSGREVGDVMICAPDQLSSHVRSVERVYGRRTRAAEDHSHGWECPLCQFGRLSHLTKSGIAKHMRDKCVHSSMPMLQYTYLFCTRHETSLADNPVPRRRADMRDAERLPVLVISSTLRKVGVLDPWEREWVEKNPMRFSYGDAREYGF